MRDSKALRQHEIEAAVQALQAFVDSGRVASLVFVVTTEEDTDGDQDQAVFWSGRYLTDAAASLCEAQRALADELEDVVHQAAQADKTPEPKEIPARDRPS